MGAGKDLEPIQSPRKSLDEVLREFDLRMGITKESTQIAVYRALGHNVAHVHGNIVIENGVSDADGTVPIVWVREIGEHGSVKAQRSYVNRDQVDEDLRVAEEVLECFKSGGDNTLVVANMDEKVRKMKFFQRVLLDLDELFINKKRASRGGKGGVDIL